jgi:hypothetical protein
MRIYMYDNITWEAQIFYKKSPKGQTSRNDVVLVKEPQMSEGVIANGSCHHGPKSLKKGENENLVHGLFSPKKR